MAGIYRIGRVAELSGVPEGVIRQWERRYGLLARRRSPGAYRLFSDEDVRRLQRLRQLTGQGISIREAVGLLEAEERPPVAGAASASSEIAGGCVQAALAAAGRSDAAGVEGALDRAFQYLPAMDLFGSVLVPLQRAVGAAWQTGVLSVAQEHLVSEAVRSRISGLLRGAAHGAGPLAVCACFEWEGHDLGLVWAALELRRAGYRVAFLGAMTPARALGAFVRQARPDLVALSAVVDRGAARFRRALGTELAVLPRGPEVVLGGAAVERHADEVRRWAPAARLGLAPPVASAFSGAQGG